MPDHHITMQADNKYLDQTFNDIVFENRNRKYGSYMLRNVIRPNTRIGLLLSMAAVVVFVAVLFIGPLLTKKTYEPVYLVNEVVLTEPPPVYETLPPAVPPAVKKVEATELTEMEVKQDDEVEENKIEIAEEKNDTLSNGSANKGNTSESKVNGDGSTIYKSVEKMPEYPGGKSGLTRYLKDNVEYPKAALDNNIHGTVLVTFVVNEDGSVSDVKLAKGIGGGCDQEAVRVVSEMRRWKPGMQGGVPVKVIQQLPISFNLNDGI